jgi:hypothetical protein
VVDDEHHLISIWRDLQYADDPAHLERFASDDDDPTNVQRFVR